MEYQWKGIIFDDVELGIDTAKRLHSVSDATDEYNDWSQVCLHCVNKHNIPIELLDSAGSGICGIKGCENESDFYIDFSEGELMLV